MKLLLLVALVFAAACVSASAAPEAQAAPSAIKPLSFWDKVKHDAEEVAKKAAEALAKKAAEELAEKLAEEAAAALLGGVDAPNQHDLQRHSIIQQINSIPNNPWVAGMNTRFAGKPVDAIKRQLGVKFNGNKLPLKMHPKKTLEELPASFDAREAWPKCPTIGEIRDQSDCGSCWAFGAVEAASDRICIDTNGAVNAHLSAEVMTGCCWECGAGCDGGDPGTAWMFLTNPGVQTGGNYGDYSWCSAYSLPNCDHHVSGQYQPCGANEYPTPACPTACDKNSTYNTPFAKDAHVFNNSYSVSSDPTQIMQEIMTEGPVEAAFTVYADFEHYKSGVYVQQSQQELGGHAIKILGWGTDSASGLPYWIVANSWNTDWGNKGYFWIVRGRDECGIEDNVVAGTYSA